MRFEEYYNEKHKESVAVVCSGDLHRTLKDLIRNLQKFDGNVTIKVDPDADEKDFDFDKDDFSLGQILHTIIIKCKDANKAKDFFDYLKSTANVGHSYSSSVYGTKDGKKSQYRFDIDGDGSDHFQSVKVM